MATLVAAVVRVPSQNCKCPIDLFGQYQPGERVGQRERSQREQQSGSFTGRIRPSVRRTDGKGNVLRALVAANPQPPGKGI